MGVRAIKDIDPKRVGANSVGEGRSSHNPACLIEEHPRRKRSRYYMPVVISWGSSIGIEARSVTQSRSCIGKGKGAPVQLFEWRNSRRRAINFLHVERERGMGSSRSIGNRHGEIVGTGNQRSSGDEVENTGQRIDSCSGRKRRTVGTGPSVSRKRSTPPSQKSDRVNPIDIRQPRLVINGAVEQIIARIWDCKLRVGGK